MHVKSLLVAGPCVIEQDGEWLADVGAQIKAHIPLGYEWTLKASAWKGNRTSSSSFRGIGWFESLQALVRAKHVLGVPVCTDVHCASDIDLCETYGIDTIQIPERLSRETALLEGASAYFGKVLLKCGLSMSPAKYAAALEKLAPADVIGCYRGTAFGDEVIFDVGRMWGMLPYAPLIADVTHATQQLGDRETTARRGLSVPYARAAASIGVDGIFAECHPDPKNALSDSSSQLRISDLGKLLESLQWA